MPGGTLGNACSVRRLVNLPKLILGGSCSNPHMLAGNRRGSNLSLLSFQVLLILYLGPLYCTCILVEADSNWREVRERLVAEQTPDLLNYYKAQTPRYILLSHGGQDARLSSFHWLSEHYLYIPVVPFLEGLRVKQNPLVKLFLFPIAS